MTVTAHLTALRYCTKIKMSLPFENCCEMLNTSNNVEVIKIYHEKFLDLESLLNDIYNRLDPKTANINHVIQVKIVGKHWL